MQFIATQCGELLLKLIKAKMQLDAINAKDDGEDEGYFNLPDVDGLTTTI